MKEEKERLQKQVEEQAAEVARLQNELETLQKVCRSVAVHTYLYLFL
jgi:predicted RNase H-like nuclease (RuvC/YqgF family)